MKILASERLHRIERFLWALTLVTVPVTSFRFMPFLGVDSQVRPLSLIPAILLVIVLTIRSFQQHRFLFWNNNFLPLLAFALAALLSSAIGFFLAPVNLYNYTYESRLLRAWISFGVGLLFLIVPMIMNRDEQDLKFTLKWLYVGLIGQVIWSLVQLLGFYAPAIVFDGQTLGNLIDQIQKIIMMAGVSPNRRISGLTLEPSWLAAQTMTVYLPWAFASVVTGYLWDQHRWLAPLIIAACGGLILFTYSRSGILIVIVAMLLTFLFIGLGWLRKFREWFLRPFHHNNLILVRRMLNVSVRLALIVVILVGLGSGSFILSRNKYFAKIWQADKSSLTSYFVSIYAGPRLASAWTGWTIFEQHPWTGVGLGATGLYFFQALPDWAHFNITEVSRLLSPDNATYPNTKILYIRLLAETGIIGFWMFISFYLLLFGKVLALLRTRRKQLVFVGTASLLAWLTIVALGISQDSLAMLNIWMPLGILIGMADSQA
jgi:hypothetical protein